MADVHPSHLERRFDVCGRLLVGQGTDTWDPVCLRWPGHGGTCSPTKPHFYRFHGLWWCSRNGYDSFKRGITMNDVSVPAWPPREALAP